MDAKAAAADGSVREALLRIEDKLYESGVLVTATGDELKGTWLIKFNRRLAAVLVGSAPESRR